MPQYIHTDDLGITTFDEYFDYLAQIKTKTNKKIHDFFSNVAIYTLHGDQTFHDAWIIGMHQALQEDLLINHGIQSQNLHLKLLNATWNTHFLLNYTDAQIQASPNHLPHTDLFGLDILYHELTLQENEQKYRHTFYFPDDKWLAIAFNDFAYAQESAA